MIYNRSRLPLLYKVDVFLFPLLRQQLTVVCGKISWRFSTTGRLLLGSQVSREGVNHCHSHCQVSTKLRVLMYGVKYSSVIGCKIIITCVARRLRGLIHKDPICECSWNLGYSSPRKIVAHRCSGYPLVCTSARPRRTEKEISLRPEGRLEGGKYLIPGM